MEKQKQIWEAVRINGIWAIILATFTSVALWATGDFTRDAAIAIWGGLLLLAVILGYVRGSQGRI